MPKCIEVFIKNFIFEIIFKQTNVNVLYICHFSFPTMTFLTFYIPVMYNFTFQNKTLEHFFALSVSFISFLLNNGILYRLQTNIFDVTWGKMPLLLFWS